MGKWSFMNHSPALIPNLYEKSKPIIELSEEELEARWVAEGSRSITDYDLQWYSGISGGGWATIDDSHGRKQFQLYVPYEDFHDSMAKRRRHEKIAVVLAHQEGMTTIEKPDQITPVTQA